VPGRLQKVAALSVAAWAFASSSAFADPDGLGARAASPVDPARDRTALELSESNAVSRWSLRAGASHDAWDPTLTTAFPRFDWRSAIAGDVSRASLALDWQHRLGPGQVSATAFGRLARTEVIDGKGGPVTVEQRLNDSLLGAALGWNAGGRFAGLPVSNSFSASFRNTGRDARAGALDERGEIRSDREDRLDASATSLAASTGIALPMGIRADAGVRLDTLRANVRSDLPGQAGAVQAQSIAPHVRLTLPVAGGRAFVSLARGSQTQPMGVLMDPRNGSAVARLDPSANMDNVEIGFQRRLPLGIETTVSMFRARSDTELLLSGETGITDLTRPTVRQGVQAVARYEPSSWLALDFHGVALHARFADGAAEYVPGAAERGASAAATLRLPAGFSASLAMNYLGKRSGIQETLPIAASTFVNARFARNLSKDTRVSLDFFNLSGQKLRDVDYFSASRLAGPAQDSLLSPAEPRGLRLWLKTTF
jgi:hypothetical protein